MLRFSKSSGFAALWLAVLVPTTATFSRNPGEDQSGSIHRMRPHCDLDTVQHSEHVASLQTSNTPGLSTSSLRALGSVLFRSLSLSGTGTVSCSSCHVPSLGFSGDHPRAIDTVGTVGRRRSPSLLGLCAQGKFMWDGRVDGLQSVIPIPLESTEMAVDWGLALSRLRNDPAVLQIDPRLNSDLDRDVVLQSLAFYIETLSDPVSRFDLFYFAGDQDALTEQEKFGLRLFTHKAHCSSCHLVDGTSAPFTDGAFHRTSLTSSNGDRGREAVTGDALDEGSIKTPTLRGVALRPFLMHDGSITNLREVVRKYNNINLTNVDLRLKPIFLTENEIEAIVDFLSSLNPIKMDNVNHTKTVDQ